MNVVVFSGTTEGRELSRRLAALAFADQNKAKALLLEQRDSQEALEVKRG